MIPDCYDPIFQEERREQEWDNNVAILPKCKLCGDVIFPGDRYHETRKYVVCVSCLEELVDNECILEE